MIYATNLKQSVSVLLIVALIFLGFPSSIAVGAPQTTSPSINRVGTPAARRALKHLVQIVHTLRTTNDQGAYGAALIELADAWRQASYMVQLTSRELLEHGLRAKNSVKTAERTQALDRSFADLAAELDGFMSQARRGPAFARAAGEKLESDLSAAFGSTTGFPNNPLPHRLASPRSTATIHQPQAIGLVRLTEASLGPADLASNDDAAITPEVKALANQLQNDPVQIFSYVLNHIAFDPYFGSRKGSLITLWERSGNDIDTASLLIALLRAGGVPARYVQAMAKFDTATLENWLGGAPDLGVAQAILKSAGIPVETGADGTPAVQHVWVEMYDSKQSSWIQLDPSFKRFRYSPAINLSAAAGFDAADFLKHVQSSELVGLNDHLQAFTGIPTVRSTVAPYDDKQSVDLARMTIANGVANLAKVITPTSSNDASFGGAFIVQQQISALPTTLPFTVAAGSASVVSFSEVPDGTRDKVTIAISSKVDGVKGFSYQASFPSLANKRVVVSYEPATDFDAQIIQEFGGTQLNTDPFLVSLVPVLRVNGIEVARGDSVDMGDVETRTLTITPAGGNAETASNTVLAGGMFAVGLGYGRAGAEELAAGQARLKAARSSVPPNSAGIPDITDPSNMSEPIIGETLNLMMQGWFNQADLYNELIARARGVRWFRGPSAGIAGQAIVFDSLFGFIFGTEGGSLFFDIQHNVVNAVSLNNSPSDVAAFMATTGMFGSALEHATIELLGQRSLSTIQLLSSALRQGGTVYRIDGTNRDAVLPKLNLYGSPITQVTNALDQGQIVTISDSEVNIGNWSGVGYMVVDPKTGGSGYYISGGLQASNSPLSGGSVVATMKSVAAFALADVNLALNAYGFAATASALLLAPEVTLAGAAATALALYGLTISVSNLEALASGDSAGSKYIADNLTALLIGSSLITLGFGAGGIVENAVLGASAPDLSTAIADYDAIAGGAASALVQAGFTQTEVVEMADKLLVTDLSDLAAFTNRFGVDYTRTLINNTFFAPGEEFTAGDLARLAVNAPDAPGLSDVINSAVASQDGNYGWVYEMQVADNLGSSVVGYHVESAFPVTYTEAVTWDANGLPVLGGSVTETAEGDLALSGNNWIEAKTARYVSGTDGALNDFVNNALRGQALIDTKQITSYTVWMKEYPEPKLLTWLWDHAPNVNFEFGLPH